MRAKKRIWSEWLAKKLAGITISKQLYNIAYTLHAFFK